jgi:transposase
MRSEVFERQRAVAGPSPAGTPTAGRGVGIDPEHIEVATQRLAGMPVINAVLDRLGLVDLVASCLDEPDPRCVLPTDQVIGVLVRNLALGRQPLYGLAGWAAGFDPALLGLAPGEAERLNDDRAGRALDELFAADRASLVTALGLAAVAAYDIDCAELHNDSTSLTLYGAYRGACGQPRGGQRPARPARGHSKDHRGDLKQLVWILTTSADGAVPITYRLADGNTEDSTTHVATWDTLAAMLGRSDFLYVADCKLATRDNFDHIASRGGRFVTVLPRSRKEDTTGRAWLAAGPVDWNEIVRRPGRRAHDPPEVWWALPAPAPSAEGHRIVWLRSSVKRVHDAAARLDRIERGQLALRELAAKLASPRCKLTSLVAVEDAARAAIDTANAARWMRVSIGQETTHEHRKVGPGRPGPNSRYRRVDKRRFTLTWSVDADQVAHDAASDGAFPLISNDKTMSPAALLAAYKGQPHLERRNHTLKSVIDAAPIQLKSDLRIDAFAFCLYAALLIHALIERQLRAAMAAAGIDQLPLYPEDRPCTTPTATRVLEILDPLARTHITHHGRTLAVVAPELTPLQRQLLDLLDVPLHAYR